MDSTKGEPQIGEMVVVAIKEEPIMSDEMPLVQHDDPLAGTEHAPIPVKRLRRLPFGLGPHATGNRKILTCEHCGYRTEYKGSMNRHKMRHSSSKSFACCLCDYRAYQAQSLKAHMMKHTTGGKTNPNQQRIWLDTNKIKSNGQIPGECLSQNVEKTEDILCNPTDYLEGVEIIEEEENKEELTRKPLGPSEDDKDYGNLKPKVEPSDQEMLSGDHDPPTTASRIKNSPSSCDEDKKLFGCTITANYGAPQLSDVKRHKQVHSDERPYGCGVCDYRALFLTHLQAHMKREHGAS